METLYKAATRNDVSPYKAICQTLITKTQVENDYNSLRILFIDNSSLVEPFQKEISQAIGICFQGGLPTQTHAYASQHGKGALVINTTGLGRKTLENCEFIILEEFCRLLDYAAADFTQNEQLDFHNEFSRYVDSRFASEIAEKLDKKYNQYYVNKFVLSFDVEKWIQFKAGYYGASFRAKLNRRFSEIRATRPPKHCLAIITSEILGMLSFVHAVDSFLVYAKLPEIQLQQLTESKNNTLKTVKFAEQNAKAIVTTYPDVVDYFRQSDFVSKNNFFIRTRQLFVFLHLFG
ncbi:MAG: hypothetical protein CW716_01310 [Candidatus Bathyarchaeum sp.]|nr:MAG: hypothetical protein CW716_01310 [Candidatus Bathyarchaeum sp.]